MQGFKGAPASINEFQPSTSAPGPALQVNTLSLSIFYLILSSSSLCTSLAMGLGGAAGLCFRRSNRNSSSADCVLFCGRRAGARQRSSRASGCRRCRPCSRRPSSRRGQRPEPRGSASARRSRRLWTSACSACKSAWYAAGLVEACVRHLVAASMVMYITGHQQSCQMPRRVHTVCEACGST